MSFNPFHLNKWLRGSTLVGNSDAIPDDALRRANNVRLDRTLGQIEARPGWTFIFNPFIPPLIWISKLFVSATTIISYIQQNNLLTRHNDTWGAGLGIIGVGSQVLSDANSPDGAGHFLKYFVNQSVAIKDDGATSTFIGILPATLAPTTAALATDLFTQIDSFEAGGAATWTGSGLSAGPADDATVFQEGTGSMSFSIAASTFGTVVKDYVVAINLDTLVGGDALVKNDDYIFLWVRVDNPQNLTYIQLDIDIDSATTSIADAWRRNYFSFKGAALTRLSGGTNEWTKLQIRKSEFTRYGTDINRSFANARVFRIGFLTNNSGTVAINIDDLKLRGGIGLEGTISYTTCYRNSSTMGRGNPPKDGSGVVLYTAPLVVDRQRVNLTTTNVRTGGANNPGDSQNDRLLIFRKGGIFTTAVLVDTITSNDPSPYLDAKSDATLVLTNIQLETDNDVPPAATTTRVIFGPDGSGHFFMIVDGFKLYISKPYERLENRADNWPAKGFALVGDGSTQVVAGLASSTQVRIWSTALSYNVVGVGQDTFLPVALDGTRGTVGKDSVAAGDGVIFFVSQDGIYEDVNGQQVKLTSAIDKFFQGITVDGQLGWSTVSTDLSDVRLAFLHEPTGSVLVMAYVEATTGTRKHLTLKPNIQTGRLTEIFFDSSNVASIRSFFLDTLRRKLIIGGSDGSVYQIEDPTAYSDNGTAIVITAREKSYDIGQPQRGKFISHTEVEGNTTSQNLTLKAYYDRAQSSETLGTLNTSTDTSVQQFPTANPTVSRRDIALEVSGSVTGRVMISRLGRYCEPQPEALTFWDSGVVTFDFIHQLKRLQLDVLAAADCTIKIFLDGSVTPAFTGTLTAAAQRRSMPFYLTSGLQASTFRVTIVSSTSTTFIPYKFSGFFKPLGVDQDYQEKVLLQGV